MRLNNYIEFDKLYSKKNYIKLISKNCLTNIFFRFINRGKYMILHMFE